MEKIEMSKNQMKLVLVLSLLGHLAPKIRENVKSEEFCASVIEELDKIMKMSDEELEKIKNERRFEVEIRGLI